MKRLFTLLVPVAVAFILIGMVAADIAYYKAERPIAIVRRFKPEVVVQNMDEGKKISLDPKENIGEKLFSGDTLSTFDDAFALVLFMDKSVAKVKPNSVLVINGEVGSSSKSMSTRINLQNGEIFLNVEPQGGNDFEVATSRSLASVKGTDFGNSHEGYVWVQNGQVDVTAINSGQTVSLFNKMFARVDENGNEINSGTLSDEELQQLGQDYNELENDLIKKELKFRFRDENGQLREITIDVFEEGQN
ncbi:FecR family protein [Gracilimonas mengyeensis]|uniref:FecR family protein n=1 Tax=Gracilimonas mengyeensis TaxID=1302730 RepID=A0A521FB49_9BACT|nr:FecR family protein [Gracilimonas mengyeensis]SMO93407.1 FecR family protein [Gracilimonas mengyeensis]